MTTSAVFVRRTRGLFEFTLSILCLWAALWHTPIGALVRSGVATVFGVRSSAKPLLSYFTGSGASRLVATTTLPVPPLGQPMTASLAMGYALHASLKGLPAAHRAPARDLARMHGMNAEALLDPEDGPRRTAELVARAGRALSSDEAAVLAVFAGHEPARYAVERARAEGAIAPTLEDLARHLPPSFRDALDTSNDALAMSVAYGLAWPVSETIPVSSGFGVREHPLLGVDKLHTGVDLPLPIGSKVRVVADGTVRRASHDAINGRVLVIDHGRGVTTAYCHNSVLMVREGERVTRGTVIALSGNTGRSTGPHLHYQLELAARPVDPFAFRPQRTATIAGGRR